MPTLTKKQRMDLNDINQDLITCKTVLHGLTLATCPVTVNKNVTIEDVVSALTYSIAQLNHFIYPPEPDGRPK